MGRKNCWEVKRCERQSGGNKAGKLGVCPAALPGQYDGVNRGKCSGRFCWAIAGTSCEGNVQGTFAEKISHCRDCEFLQSVRDEEGESFKLTRQDVEASREREDVPLFQQTAALAQKIFIFLVKQEIPATPENYRVWFAYHSGTHEDLAREVHEKISRGIPLDRELTAQLHERYFGDHDKQRIISLVESQAALIMKDIITNLLISMDGTSEYNKKLHHYSHTLSGSNDIQDIRRIINALISDTKKFEDANVALQHKLEHITAETKNLKKQIERHEQDLLKDPLTGLYNRRALSGKLTGLFSDFQKNGSVFSVIMTDINSFKQFNDLYGHIIGDSALQIVSATLEENTKGNDFVGRYGGDEFILLLPATNLYSASIVAEKLGRAVSGKKLQLKKTGKTVESIHISLGISQMQEGDTPESLIERADAALALAKTDKALVRSEKDLS